MKGYIYKYTFPDGKVYIGQTRRDPKIREKEHIDPVTGPANPGFWKAYQQYGEYKYEIINEFEDNNPDTLIKVLNALESSAIIKCHAYDPRYGYNIRMFGCAHSDKEKIKNQKAQEMMNELWPIRTKMLCSIYTKIFSTKEYLTVKEKKYLDVEKTRNIGHPYPYNCDNINKVLHNKRIVDDNIFLHEFFEEMKERIEDELWIEIYNHIEENEASIILQYRDDHLICKLDMNDNVIGEYQTYAEAAESVGKNTCSSIRDTVKGKWKTAYGYKWKLKKELKKQQP